MTEHSTLSRISQIFRRRGGDFFAFRQSEASGRGRPGRLTFEAASGEMMEKFIVRHMVDRTSVLARWLMAYPAARLAAPGSIAHVIMEFINQQ